MVILEKVVLTESELDNDQVKMMIEMVDYALHLIMVNLHNYSVIADEDAIDFLRLDGVTHQEFPKIQ